MDYKDKKVLIAGFSIAPGSEALALVDYLKSAGVSDVAAIHWGGEEVAAQMPDDMVKISVESAKAITSDMTEGYDVVFRSPPVNPSAVAGDHIVSSATKEFFDKCPAPIIGVTGTKGKGTTSTLISMILQAAGKRVHLVGNIGIPAIKVLPDILPDDIVVHEISSYQLWDLTVSPHIAVVLMIEQDHLDTHADMEDYVGAKGNISRYQTVNDRLFHHPTNELSIRVASYGDARKEAYMSQGNAYIQDDKVWLKGVEICSTQEVGLLGHHNLENVCAALAAASCFTDDIAAMKKAVTEFTGLENRLEFVEKVDGVSYYNDTFSAAPMATRAAVEAFDEPLILILGGVDKKLDYHDLARTIADRKVKKVLLIGEVKQKIAQTFDDVDFANYEIIDDGVPMVGIVDRAYDLAEKDAVVLLSPGTSSFDMFKDFKDRGQQFKDAVASL